MTKDYFGKLDSEWNWESFVSTEGFPVSPDLMDWIIGQDKAIEECKLCLDEWIHKNKNLKKRKWWKFWEKPETAKPQAKEWLPAGPFLLLIGTQGTGKSLLGRALATHLTKLYEKYKIQLYDVISWKNKVMPSNPKISIHPSGMGKKIVNKLRVKALKKNRFTKWGLRLMQSLMIGFGVFVLGVTFYHIGSGWFGNDAFGYPMQLVYDGNFIKYLVDAMMANVMMIYLGIGALSMGAMLFIFKHILGGLMGGSKKGIGGAESVDSPKLIVDNSSGGAKFIDATGHGSAQLYGSIAWDPYQTGGLGTPEHQRVSAGDVHRAFMGILYIDEIKNLHGQEAVTLLTVLEDGQLPIALRSQFHGGDTAAMAVSTEPVPCMLFFVAAGNLDSVPHIHPALMDRIAGYGRVVYMNDDMPNDIKNRRKYVQFITQEIQRFNLLPFSREACMEIIEESRRKSGRKDRLSCLFRPMISVIKTASVLAMNEGLKVVEGKHVYEAINEHCKTIYRQVLEQKLTHQTVHRVIDPKAEPKIGQVHGIAINAGFEGCGQIGSILPIRASIIELKKKETGYFNVTGVNVEAESWIQQSILKVRHVFRQLYDKDPEDDFKTHIDFAQMKGVEGPSAGIAMAIALISAYTGKPARQDVAITGEINIGINDKVIVTPIGGTHEKIIAAQEWGFKKVLIPERNYKYDIVPKDYKIKIVSCATLEDYKREVMKK